MTRARCQGNLTLGTTGVDSFSRSRTKDGAGRIGPWPRLQLQVICVRFHSVPARLESLTHSLHAGCDSESTIFVLVSTWTMVSVFVNLRAFWLFKSHEYPHDDEWSTNAETFVNLYSGQIVNSIQRLGNSWSLHTTHANMQQSGSARLWRRPFGSSMELYEKIWVSEWYDASCKKIKSPFSINLLTCIIIAINSKWDGIEKSCIFTQRGGWVVLSIWEWNHRHQWKLPHFTQSQIPSGHQRMSHRQSIEWEDGIIPESTSIQNKLKRKWH